MYKVRRNKLKRRILRRVTHKIYDVNSPTSLITEVLERRLLLSGDPFKYSAGPDNLDAILKVNANTLELYQDGSLAQSALLSDVSRVEITGGDQADKLLIDGFIGKSILFKGGTGDDSIAFSNMITGPEVALAQGYSATILAGDGTEQFTIRTDSVESYAGDSSGNLFKPGKLDVTDQIAITTGSGDTLDYSSYGKPVQVNLSGSSFQYSSTNLTANSASALLDSNLFAGIIAVTGGSKSDILAGGDNAELFTGAGGADILAGGKGNDTLTGGRGDDIYVFANNWGEDLVEEKRFGGDDTLDFSLMSDTLVITVGDSGGKTAVSATSGLNKLVDVTYIDKVVGSGGQNTYAILPGDGELEIDDLVSANGTLDFSGFTEDIEFTISENAGGDLEVRAVSGDREITAQGIEKIIGGSGNDKFIYQGTVAYNSLSIDGGSGDNTIDFSGYDTAVTVDLSTAGWTRIKTIVGSDQDDDLTGDSNANILIGGKGSDTLKGGGGNDTFEFEDDWNGDSVDGGGGVNTVSFSQSKTDIVFKISASGLSQIEAGDDSNNAVASVNSIQKLTGGKGSDWLDYSPVTGDIVVTLSSGSAEYVNGGAPGSVSGVENIIAAQGVNTLSGNDDANIFVLYERADWSGGADNIVGGGGNDTVSYENFTSGVTLDLSGDKKGKINATEITTTSGIENLTGGAGADVLTGDSQANILTGGPGNDILTGKGGQDRYVFGENWGQDTVVEDDGGAWNRYGNGFVDTLDFMAVASSLTWQIEDPANASPQGDDDKGIVRVYDEADFAGSTNRVDASGGFVERLDGMKENDTVRQENLELTQAEVEAIIGTDTTDGGLDLVQEWAGKLGGAVDELLDVLVFGAIDTAGAGFLKQRLFDAVGDLVASVEAYLGGAGPWQTGDGSDDGSGTVDNLFEVEGITVSPTSYQKEFRGTVDLGAVELTTNIDLVDAISDLLGDLNGVDASGTLGLTMDVVFTFSFGLEENGDFYLADPALMLDNGMLGAQHIDLGFDLGILAAGVNDGTVAFDFSVGFETTGHYVLTQDVVNNFNYKDLSGRIVKEGEFVVDLPFGSQLAGLSLDLATLRTVFDFDTDLFGGLTLGEFITQFDTSISLDAVNFDLGDLSDLGKLSLADIYDALKVTVDLVFDPSGLWFEEIPGIELNLDDLTAGIGQAILDAIEWINPANWAGSLQEIEGILDAKISLPNIPTQLGVGEFGAWVNPDFSLGFNDGELFYGFTFDAGYYGEKGFGFDMADFAGGADGLFGDGGLFTVQAGGNLFVDARTALEIGVGIDLLPDISAGESFEPYVTDTSGIDASVTLGGKDLTFVAAINTGLDIADKIGLHVKEGTAVAGASLGISLKEGVDGKIPVTDLSFVMEARGEFSVDLPMYITESLPVSGSTDDLDGDGVPDNVLKIDTAVSWDNTSGLQFDGVTVITPDFASTFNAFSLINNPDVLLAGVQNILNKLRAQTPQLGDLPLVGQHLGSVDDFIANDIYQKIDDTINAARGFINGRSTIEIIQDELYNALGPDGLDILSVIDDTVAQGNSGRYVMASLESFDDASGKGTRVTFNLKVAGTIFDESIKLEFGDELPGLGLDVETEILASVDYELNFCFGVDVPNTGLPKDGNYKDLFFVDAAAGPGGKEFVLNAMVGLQDGAHLDALLGFMRARVETLSGVDDEDGILSQVMVNASIDLRDDQLTVGQADGRLTLDELTASENKLKDFVEAEVVGIADVDLYAEIGFDSVDFLEASANVHYRQELTWNPEDPDGNGKKLDVGSPLVSLENVALDLGPFMNGVVGDTLKQVKKITSPMQPIADIWNGELPVIGELGGPATLGDLAKLFAGADKNLDKFVTVIDALVTIVDAVNSLPDSPDGKIYFGDFILVGADQTPSASEPGYDTTTSDRQNDSQFNPTGGGQQVDSGSKSFVDKYVSKKPGEMEFPVLTDPKQMFNLITGRPADIFRYELPSAALNFEYSQSFPIFTGLNARLSGSISAGFNLGFGYDTSGLNEYISQVKAKGFDQADESVLLDGFYLNDHKGSGDGPITDPATGDRAEAWLTARIAAGASVGIGGLIEAYVEGGFTGEIAFDLAEPYSHDFIGGAAVDLSGVNEKDGKVTFTELDKRFQYYSACCGPLCMIETSGRLGADLTAGLWVGLKVFGAKLTLFDASITLAQITLASFGHTCSPKPAPDPASLISLPALSGPQGLDDISPNGGGSVLVLHMGDYASNRGSTGSEDIDPNADTGFIVEVVDTLDNDGKVIEKNGSVKVTYNDAYVEYFDIDEVTHIKAIGGDGNDMITIKKPKDETVVFAPTVEFTGGGGDDYALIQTDGDVLLDGGAGNDVLVAGGGNDTIIAGAGNDYLEGGAGDDILFGGGGDDIIQAGFGDDFLYGDGMAYDNQNRVEVAPLSNAQQDQAGIQGDDTLIGGGGNDVLIGYGGNDILVGDGTIPKSKAEKGGAEGVDYRLVTLVHPNPGPNDPLTTQIAVTMGSDFLLGGDGDDRISGDEGDDYIHGENGNDSIQGGDGDDLIGVHTYDQGDFTGAWQEIWTQYLADINGVVTENDADTLRWTSGEGADQVNLGDGDDLLELNGADSGDSWSFEAGTNPADLLMTLSGMRTNLVSVEKVILNAGQGADQFGINDLRTTTVTDFDIRLGGSTTSSGTVNTSGPEAREVILDPDGAGVILAASVETSGQIKQAVVDYYNSQGVAINPDDVTINEDDTVSVNGQVDEITAYPKQPEGPAQIFTADAAADNVTLRSSDGPDNFAINSVVTNVIDDQGQTHVQPLWRIVQDQGAVRYTIRQANRATGDRLLIQTMAAGDEIDAGGVSGEHADIMQLVIDAGDGQDTLRGTAFADILKGGAGDDVYTGGAGVDNFYDLVGRNILEEARNADFELTGGYLIVGDFSENPASPLSQNTLNASPESYPQYPDPDQWLQAGATKHYGWATDAEFENLANVNFATFRLSGQDQVISDQWQHPQNIFYIHDFNAEVFLDGQGGSDRYVLDLATSPGARFIEQDSGGVGHGNPPGSTIGNDAIVITGTDQADTFGFNADSYNANPSDGEVTMGDTILKYNGPEYLLVHGLAGDDVFLVDDNGVPLHIFGGAGADQFQIGQVVEAAFTDDIPAILYAAEMTNGVSMVSYFYGGTGNDYMEVNHNLAEVFLFGEDDNDKFVINANLEVDKTANIYGGIGNNQITYVQNAKVNINGGEGIDTVVINGTPIDDTFIIAVVDGKQVIYGAGIQVGSMEEVELLEVNGAGGNDSIYVFGTVAGLDLVVNGGFGDDTIYVGGEEASVYVDPPAYTYQPPSYMVDPAPFQDGWKLITVDPGAYLAPINIPSQLYHYDNPYSFLWPYDKGHRWITSSSVWYNDWIDRYWAAPLNRVNDYITGQAAAIEQDYKTGRMSAKYRQYLSEYIADGSPEGSVSMDFSTAISYYYNQIWSFDDESGNGQQLVSVLDTRWGSGGYNTYGNTAWVWINPQPYQQPVPNMIDPPPYQVVPEPVTVDPAPFLFTAGPQKSLSQFGGSFTVDGGEGANDRIVINSQDDSAPGRIGLEGGGQVTVDLLDGLTYDAAQLQIESVTGAGSWQTGNGNLFFTPDSEEPGIGTVVYTFNGVLNKEGNPKEFIEYFRYGQRTVLSGRNMQPGVTIEFGNASVINIELSDAADVFTVNSTPQDSTTVVNARAGNDIIHVESAGGITIIEGGADDDTIYVGFDGANPDNAANGTLAGIPDSLIIRGGEGDDQVHTSNAGALGSVPQTGALQVVSLDEITTSITSKKDTPVAAIESTGAMAGFKIQSLDLRSVFAYEFIAPGSSPQTYTDFIENELETLTYSLYLWKNNAWQLLNDADGVHVLIGDNKDGIISGVPRLDVFDVGTNRMQLDADWNGQIKSYEFDLEIARTGGMVGTSVGTIDMTGADIFDVNLNGIQPRYELYRKYGNDWVSSVNSGLRVDVFEGLITGTPLPYDVGTNTYKLEMYWRESGQNKSLTYEFELAIKEVQGHSGVELDGIDVRSMFGGTLENWNQVTYHLEGLPAGSGLKVDDGLKQASAKGLIIGRPTPMDVTGPSGRTIKLVAISDTNQREERSLTIFIDQPVEMTGYKIGQIDLRTAIEKDFGSLDNVTYTISGLANSGLNFADGVIDGVPLNAGQYAIQLTAKKGAQTENYSFDIDVDPLTSYINYRIKAVDLKEIFRGQFNDPGLVSYTVAGLDNTGFVLDPDTWRIVGIPTTPGNQTWTVTATDGSKTLQQVLTMEVKGTQPPASQDDTQIADTQYKVLRWSRNTSLDVLTHLEYAAGLFGVDYSAATLNSNEITALDGNDYRLKTITDQSVNQVSGSTLIQTGVPGGFIEYNGVEVLTVETGSQDDRFDILSTMPGMTVTVKTHDGADQVNILTTGGSINLETGSQDDTVNIGSNSPSFGGDLNNLMGVIAINAGDGTDQLNIDDTGETLDGSGQLSFNQFTGFGLDQSIDYTGFEDLNLSLGEGKDTLTIVDTHTGTTQIHTGPNDDQIYIRTIQGPTTVASGDGNDQIAVSSITGQLNGIMAPLRLLGQGDTDTLYLIDSGESQNASGTLTGTTLTGLGMTATVSYETFELLSIHLGRQNDNLTINGTHTGVTEIYGANGEDTFAINQINGPTSIFGGDNTDRYFVTTIPSLTSQWIPGVLDTLTLDGQSGADQYQVVWSGHSAYEVNIEDHGLGVDADQMTIFATGQNDTILFRQYFVALLNDLAGNDQIADAVERINYNYHVPANDTTGLGVETMFVYGLGGNDFFALDDNSAETTLDGGIGNDWFQIGQLFATPRDANAGIEPRDQYLPADLVEVTTDGSNTAWLTNGVSRATTIHGGDDNDVFSVYHNIAEMNLNGQDGDDYFVVRSFVVKNDPTGAKAQKEIDIDAGSGDNTIAYAANSPVNVNGGAGFDTLLITGTYNDDRFVITENAIYGAGRINWYTDVEVIEVDGLEGDDTIFVQSTSTQVVTKVTGGLGNDTIELTGTVTGAIDIGLAAADLAKKNPDGVSVTNGKFATFPIQSHTLTRLGGPLVIKGGLGQVQSFVPDKPIMLPHETDGGAGTGPVLPDTPILGDDNNATDRIHVNNDQSNANDTGLLTESRLTGLGLSGDLLLDVGDGRKYTFAGGISYTELEQFDLYLGGGSDHLLVADTHHGLTTIDLGNGNDVLDIEAISGQTEVDAGAGNDQINVGQPAGNNRSLAGIDDSLSIDGETGSDTIWVSNRSDNGNRTGTLTDDSLTWTDMVQDGITYMNTETLNIDLGDGMDTFTIESTHTGLTHLNSHGQDDTINIQTISGRTEVLTEAGQDVVNVGTTAPETGGTLDAIGAVLSLDAGTDLDVLNLDDSADTNDNVGVLTAVSLAGFDMAGQIQYTQFDDLNLTTGSGSDTLNIVSTHTGQTTARLAQGDDLVNIANTLRRLDDIDGRLDISGGSGDDTVRFDDSGDTADNTGYLANDTLTGLGLAPAGIGYLDFETTELLLGRARDTLYITSIHAGITAIETGAGIDAVHVGSTMPEIGGTVDDMVGLLQITGANDGDWLDIDDTAAVDDRVLNLTGSQITGLTLPQAIEYTGLSDLTIGLGSGNDIINVQGTTAHTILRTNAGDESFYVASLANVRLDDDPDDTLSGDLNAILGDLELVAGSGTHTLLMSDEADTLDTTGASWARGAEGMAESEMTLAGLSGGRIGFSSDTESGDFSGGVNLWLGQANDQFAIDATHRRAGVHTITTVWANTGNDNITMALDENQDDTLVVHGQEGQDTLNGSASTHRLYLFGEQDADTLSGGSNDDVIFGDFGSVEGDWRAPMASETLSPELGGSDIIVGNAGNDILFGGSGNDTIDGMAGSDVILGDHGSYDFTAPAGQTILSIESAYAGNDTLFGGAGDDFILGQQGDDMIYGQDGQDDLIGGHNHAGGADGADVIDGGADADVILGDNGIIPANLGKRSVGRLSRALCGCDS